jgi:signal transduction histidine kinase
MHLRIIYTFTLIAQLLSAQASTATDTVLTLFEFERLYVADERSPPEHIKHGWESIELKDVWQLKRRAQFQEAWYRSKFELSEAPEAEFAVYVARVSAAASFWINGTEIGSTGRFTEPLPRSWNHPLLLVVPRQLLKTGTNRLDIRLMVVQSQIGFLYEVLMGPHEILSRMHGRSNFAKVTATRILTAIMLLGAVVILTFYRATTLPKAYLWFALGSLFWVLYSLELVVKDIPVTTRVWVAFYATSLLFSAFFFAKTVHATLNMKRIGFERALLIFAIASCTALLLLPPVASGFVSGLTIVASALIFMQLGFTLCLHGRRGSDESRLALTATGTAIIVLIAYDTFMATAGITADFAKYPYIPLVATVCGGSVFIRRLIQVARAGETQEARTQVAMQSAVRSERRRLMQEIHDGVGGQLVSTLARLEKDSRSTHAVADSLRLAMSDLRLIVHSLDSVMQDGDIATILATVRERLEKGLNDQGIYFDWRVEAMPQLENFGSEEALQLMRIVQEAVSNIIQYARASTITLASGPVVRDGIAGVLIRIADNGIGCDETQRSVGHGIANMTERATRLGGALQLHSSERGTEVQLWIPLTRSDV